MKDKPPSRSEQALAIRKRAEEIALENAAGVPVVIDDMSPVAIRLALHELRVHQIQLEMQNEALRRTQEELAVSQQRYFDLYDMAPAGYVNPADHAPGFRLALQAPGGYVRSVGRNKEKETR